MAQCHQALNSVHDTVWTVDGEGLVMELQWLFLFCFRILFVLGYLYIYNCHNVLVMKSWVRMKA
jgi:hypothetical protein